MKRIVSTTIVSFCFLNVVANTQVRAASYEQEVLADNPFVYYRFEETSGFTAADSSGNGHDAEYVDGFELGLPSADVGLGNAVRFDGTGYVQVPILDFEADQLTIETWVNLEELAGGCCTSIFSPNRWEQGWLHYNLKNDGDIEFALNSGGPNNHNTEPATVPFDEWMYIASVYDKDDASVRTFVNGEEFDVNPPDFQTPQTVRLVVDAQIAAWQNTRFLVGSLDEFAIYDTALSQERILAHINASANTGAALLAGDADQDFKFDQIDLVKVQIAAKYLSGQAATWGEGDWDGAPGGEPGNPPAGNGFFDQLDIIEALSANIYLTGPYNAIRAGGAPGDARTSIVYNPGTGEIAVDAPAGTELTSINIDSAAAVFTGEAALNLGGSFDNDADNNIFKATFGSSFGSLTFGNVAQTGLSEEFVLNDLTVIGSLAGGGDLGDVDLIYVPEPATYLLLMFGILGLVAARRRRIEP